MFVIRTLDTAVDGAGAAVAKEGGYLAADGLEQDMRPKLARCWLVVQQQVRHRTLCLAWRDIGVDDVYEEIAVLEAHHGELMALSLFDV
jgi:hypothetical protein